MEMHFLLRILVHSSFSASAFLVVSLTVIVTEFKTNPRVSSFCVGMSTDLVGWTIKSNLVNKVAVSLDRKLRELYTYF